MANITVAITGITDQECADVMTTAIEGGIGYWCEANDVQRFYYDRESWDYLSFDAYEDNGVRPGAFLGKVTYDTIRTGVNRIVSGEVQVNDYFRKMVLANFQDDEPMDADGADICIQAGLLNEIRYG